MLFSQKGDFAEYRLQRRNPQEKELKDPTPDLSSLPEGEYKGIRYGYIFELEDGTKYKTKYGVRNSRNRAGSPKLYRVNLNAEEPVLVEVKKFTGFAEISAGMQGATYGDKPAPGENTTRITVDTKGFRIPENTQKALQLKQKKFAEITSLSGEYRGGIAKPLIGIKNDKTIMRRDLKGVGLSTDPSETAPNQPNKARTLSLDWENKNPFHLGIEPWITTPIISDTDDGLYIGTVKGEEFATKSGVIMLGIKLAIDYPETVLGLVRSKKLYIFKQSQITSNINSKVFSNMLMGEDGNYHSEKYFSVNSDEEFRSYAHNLMKEAHKDNYSESKTNEVVDGILKDRKEGEDYGNLIGKLKSGLGNKSYADVPDEVVDKLPDYAFSPTAIDWTPDGVDSVGQLKLQNVIGTMVMSVAYTHLYHWCTKDYVVHKALEEYYNRMPWAVDKLAEHYLANVDSGVIFKSLVIPGLCPIEYMDKLVAVLEAYSLRNADVMKQYQSEFDEVFNIVKACQYKLRRLTEGKRVFSKAGDIASSGIHDAVDSITESILNFWHKFHRSPVKELKTSDGKIVKEYVRKQLMSPKTSAELVKSIMDSVATSVKYSLKF